MLQTIEKLKQDYTDQYVEVDASVPELARFEGHVGQVKTVNMSGRALVEFAAWNNIGWYDIDLDYLKIVPKPEPQALAAKPAKAPAKPATKAPAVAPGGKKLSPLEMARMQGAAKAAAPAGGAKKSTADILAAARAAKAGAAQPAAEPSAEKKSPAPGAKSKMSTADVLAAARAKKNEDSPAEPTAQASAPPADEQQAEPVAQKAAPAVPQEPVAKDAPPAFAKGERPSVAEILAWCRAHDAK